MRINTTESKGPGPGVLVLFVVLAIILMTVWIREGESGPLHKVRTATHVVAAPFSAAGEFVTRPMRAFGAWVSDLGVSRSSLAQLRAQNEALRTRVAELEESRLENARLKALLSIPQPKSQRRLGAHVIGRPTNSWERTIVIDRGTADGVKIGMPVLGPQGLLGQTVETTGRTATVRLLTDQRSGVAAFVQRSRAEGIVKGSIDGRLSFDFVSAQTTVTPGDVVITSGLGGVYPKGLVIGEVAEVNKQPGDLYQSITVDPSGDVSRLEDVVVLLDAPAALAPDTGE